MGRSTAAAAFSVTTHFPWCAAKGRVKTARMPGIAAAATIVAATVSAAGQGVCHVHRTSTAVPMKAWYAIKAIAAWDRVAPRGNPGLTGNVAE